MIEKLIQIDKELFLKLNQAGGPGMDPVMLFLSGPIPWILFFSIYIILLGKPSRESISRYLVMTGAILVVLALSDQLSVHLFKNLFERLRPCHEPELVGEFRLVARSCGGSYGFVSTHTSNAFSLALLSSLLIKKRWFSISVFIWAVLISYSRIYVGVHYPGDVIGGMVLGLGLGVLGGIVTFRVLKTVNRKS